MSKVNEISNLYENFSDLPEFAQNRKKKPTLYWNQKDDMMLLSLLYLHGYGNLSPEMWEKRSRKKMEKLHFLSLPNVDDLYKRANDITSLIPFSHLRLFHQAANAYN